MPVIFTSFRIAQVLGLGGATWLSGNIASLSIFSAPALERSLKQDLVSPTAVARQWKHTLEGGKANPPAAAAISAALAFCAWSVPVEVPMNYLFPKAGFGLFGVASFLAFSIIPFTVFTILPINRRIVELADQPFDPKAGTNSALDKAELGSLLRRWGTLNWIRSMLLLSGSVAALMAGLV
ncbi:hypothetical protein BKA60DRAFT_687482 [Fusarium oxysporum]|nr:hypothetical protein BKA60DRAFT_687482 [Fusarium oxysporum]